MGAEKNAILVRVEETLRASWLAAQLTDTRSELDVHVGVAIEARADVVEILRAVSDVQGDELRFRVALEDAIACF